jgi:hypothetical protein
MTKHLHTRRPVSSFQLEAMALEIPDVPDHPNRVPFSGVLTRLDRPSDRAPNGAAGHRVMMPRSVAEKALPSLLGMAVDFAPGLRGHDVRRKIGVITRAEIVADRLEIAGFLFGKDFPEVTREIRAAKDRLGMSYEVTQVRVANPAADVWRLTHVVFTGAAILERSAAAYQATSLAASATRQEKFAFAQFEGEPMDEKLTQTLDLVAQSSQALAAEFAGLRAGLEELRQAQDAMLRLMECKLPASAAPAEIETRVADLARTTDELRRQNESLRAQAERFTAQVTRKTVAPQVQTLLAKSGVGLEALNADGHVDAVVLDKALEGLPVEQRMAIKSQLARAGAIL